MSGNPYGWGNPQQGWGPPPQQGGYPGYQGYPGYPPPPRQPKFRLWHFLAGLGVLLVLLFGACAGFGVWLLTSYGPDGGVATGTDGDENVNDETGPRIAAANNPAANNRAAANSSSGNSADTGTSSPPPRADAASPDLPDGVRPLQISAFAAPRDIPTSTPVAPTQVQTVAWSVKPDPAAAPPAEVVESLNLPQDCQILQAGRPWPYLFVKSRTTINRRSTWVVQIWDLTKGKGLAWFPPEKFSSRDGSLMAVSPDGERIAIQASGISEPTILVASTKNGKVEKTLNSKAPHPKWMRFVDANRLMVASADDTISPITVEIHPLGEGKPATIRDERLQNGTVYAVSPGGKYVALPLKQQRQQQDILVFDTDSGNLAGDMQMTIGGAMRELRSIAFSPDGGRLACLIQARDQTCYLAGVDLSTGKTAFTHVVTIDTSPLGMFHKDSIPELQWLPDGRGCLLMGRDVCDVASGETVFKPTVGKLEVSTATRGGPDGIEKFDYPHLNAAWLYGSRLLIHSVSPRLFAVDIDSKTLAEKGVVFAASADATGLPLAAVDVAGAQTVAGAAVSWNVPLSSPAPLKSPVRLTLPRPDTAAFFGSRRAVQPGEVYNSFCYGKGPAPRLLLTSYVPGHHSGLHLVHPYDLSRGVPLPRFTLPRACDLAGMNDAGQVLTINRADELRVDLWSSADGSHVRGWQPYAAAAGDARKLAWADFASDGKVLTLNRAGELIGWAADAPRAVYRRKLEGGGKPLMSGSKAWLVWYDGQAVLVIDAHSGQNLGAIPLPGRELAAPTLRGDDRMLAGLLRLHDGTEQLCVCDLSDGSVPARFAPSQKLEHLAWFGDNQLLLNDVALVDLNEGLEAWMFPRTSLVRVGEFGGLLWLRDNERLTGCKLEDLPSGRDLADAFAKGAASLFAPGDEVAFSGEAEFAENGQKCILHCGYRCRSGAPRKLRVSVREESTGKQHVYSRGGITFGRRSRGAEEISLDEVVLSAEVSLLDASGNVAWSKEYKTPMPSFLSTSGENPDLASAVRARQRETCALNLAGVSLPHRVIRVRGKPMALPGRSTLEEELYGPAETSGKGSVPGR